MYKQGLSLFVQLTYDDAGRFTSYGSVKNGELDPYDSAYYHYDEKGQLTLADSDKTSTQTYTYDSHGNIKKINHYAYTRGEISENAQCDVDKFKYEEADPWPDKLSGIENGINEIVYDENGNPISLDDTTVSWTNGRQLESFNVTDENGNEVPFLSYTYDDNGIRTSKTYGDTTTYYTNIDGNVTAQYQLDENGNIINLAEFIYDSSDNVIGFTYEGETYFYLKNLQNDVLAVIDSKGELMAKYDYSTWGWHTGWSNNDVDVDIYDVNPFRYRSYIYDEEMSMCYLQSRYYITTFGRFLNSDLPEYAKLQKNDHTGLNLFAYCNNDPVNNVDHTGCYKMNGYKTEKEAVLAFAKQHYYVSRYIQYELFGLVYRYYKNGKKFFGCTEYAFGNEHDCKDPLNTCKYYSMPKGAYILAVVHTHPSPNGIAGLSEMDYTYARNNKISIYSIGYNKKIFYYYHGKVKGDSEKIYNSFLPRLLTASEKNKLRNNFQSKWNSHIRNKPNCPYKCKRLKWPVN